MLVETRSIYKEEKKRKERILYIHIHHYEVAINSANFNAI